MKINVFEKKDHLILELKADPESRLRDRDILSFINILKRGPHAGPLSRDVIYLELSGLISNCSWIDALTMIDPPTAEKPPVKEPGTAILDDNGKPIIVGKGKNIHYLTTEDGSGRKEAHLIILPEYFDTKAIDNFQKAVTANFKTVCGKAVFTDVGYKNAIFSDGFGAGDPRCTTCLARAEKHLK